MNTNCVVERIDAESNESNALFAPIRRAVSIYKNILTKYDHYVPRNTLKTRFIGFRSMKELKELKNLKRSLDKKVKEEKIKLINLNLLLLNNEENKPINKEDSN